MKYRDSQPSTYPAARPVSLNFRRFADLLDVEGEIQAGGKIEVLIGLYRGEVVSLFCPKQRTPAFAFSDTFAHRDARDMANKG